MMVRRSRESDRPLDWALEKESHILTPGAKDIAVRALADIAAVPKRNRLRVWRDVVLWLDRVYWHADAIRTLSLGSAPARRKKKKR